MPLSLSMKPPLDFCCSGSTFFSAELPPPVILLM